MKEATALIGTGKLIPLMDTNCYTMGTVEAAYAAMEERTAKGKVVVEIGV
jgi:NADPH:quinone reductase-like Zn-dependent oxidoreductase